jgi:hypothetical protein
VDPVELAAGDGAIAAEHGRKTEHDGPSTGASICRGVTARALALAEIPGRSRAVFRIRFAQETNTLT